MKATTGIMLPAGVVIITMAVFSASFANDFQRGWDDQWQVLENPFVTDVSWEYFSYHLTHFFHGQYSPVNTWFYMIVYALAGYNAAAFHGLSLGIHLANVLLVFLLARKVLEISRTFPSGKVLLYAGLTALVFAVHPLQVETVAWISASKVLLYAFFTLLALLIYIRYIETGRYRLLAGVMVCYLLAFGSKEQAVILPVTLFTVDYITGRLRTLKENGRLFWRQRVLAEKIPFILVALLMWYFSARNNLGHITAAHAYPLGQRLVFGAHSIVVYVFRFLAPVKMYYFYFYPMVQGEPLPALYWSYPVLLGILVWFVVEQYRKGNRLTVFGGMFFFVNLLLVIHLLPMPRKMITADRYMYLSVAGRPGIGSAPLYREGGGKERKRKNGDGNAPYGVVACPLGIFVLPHHAMERQSHGKAQYQRADREA